MAFGPVVLLTSGVVAGGGAAGHDRTVG